MKFLIVLATVLVAALAAPERIIGGEETTIDKYPSIAQVESTMFGNDWSQICAANILTTTLLVSAAHCFLTLASNTRIRAGTTSRNFGGEIHYLERYLVHPNYNYGITGEDYDIALVYLSTPFEYSDTIQPINIIAQGNEIPDGSVVTHAGWGALTPIGTMPNTLHEVDIYTVNLKECQTRYNDHPFGWFLNYRISTRMICAGILDVGGKDACYGDNGGPLYFSNLLVGLVSWGAACADPVYPSISTKISSFTDWILANA